jgi:hypothetical protein
MLPALDPRTAPVDGKTLAQNLAFLYGFAQEIKLLSESNGLAGTWAQMLHTDPSFLLASIATTPMASFPPQYAAAINLLQTPGDPQAQGIGASRLAGLVNALGAFLADWVTRMPSADADPLQLNSSITAILKSSLSTGLAPWQPCIQALITLVRANPSEIAGVPLLSGSEAVTAILAPLLPVSSTQPSFYTVLQCADYLSTLYQGMYRSVYQIQVQLSGLLPFSLDLPSHQPHNALLLAFQQMMATASTAMNTLTARHLDFYYRSVLQLRPLAPVADQVFVQFTLNKGVATAQVPAQTALIAGKGQNGANLIYQTAQDLTVNTITATRFLSVTNTGAGQKVPCSGILYAAPVADSYDGQGAAFPKGAVAEWPAFSLPVQPAATPTYVGFAIADPVLIMSDGLRSIGVAFNLDPDKTATLLAALAPALPATSPPTSIFSLAYTGPKGWSSITGWSLSAAAPTWLTPDTVAGMTGYLWLSAALGLDAPAVVGYDAALHGPGYQAGVPVLRLLLDASQGMEDSDSAEALQNPYNALQALSFSELDIFVDVQGKTDFLLLNDFAQLDATKPFQPFGPAPILSSNFYIGSPEVFRKSLLSISLNIDWMQLPADPNGFADYYDIWNQVAPDTPFNNEIFRVAFAIRQQNGWTPLPPLASTSASTVVAPTDFQLYDVDTTAAAAANDPTGYNPQAWLSQNAVVGSPPLSSPPISSSPPIGGISGGDGTLLSTSTFSGFDLSQLNATALTQIPASSLSSGFALGNAVPTGFLRLSLSAPSYGFGSALYSKVNFLVNQANITYITNSAKGQSSSPPALLAPPAQPYVPVAQAISLDYQAQSRYTASGPNPGQFWMVQPFGVTAAISAAGAVPLFPTYPDAGMLYIGLAQVKAPQLLTLLIQVDENSAVERPGLPLPVVTWSQLIGDTWTPLTSSTLISDGTRNFSQSGIVEILLNQGPASGTAAWFCGLADANGLLWLSASVPSNAAATCKVLQIGTQAVLATYQIDANAASHLAQPLPAGSITKFVTPPPGIAGVSQPLPSSGGKPPETDTQYYTRVHERLRHKNRGITPWDIERILLQDFPALGLANCFPHSDLVRAHVPGSTLVIVFPGQGQGNQSNPYSPKFNLAAVEAMQDQLNSVIPLDMAAILSNPVYETLQVVATLDFEPGLDPGTCIQQLQADLCNYISPWVLDPAGHNPYDTLLSTALIRGFINGLSYVQRLVTLQVRHQASVAGQTVIRTPKDDYAYFEPVCFHAILTSASQHLLGDAEAMNTALMPTLIVGADPPMLALRPASPVLSPPASPPVGDQPDHLTIRLY